MKKIVIRKDIMKLLGFILAVNLTPNFDSIYTFYLTDYMKFSTTDLADF